MRRPILLLLWLLPALVARSVAAEPPAVAFSFLLSDFSGVVRAGEARVVVDPEHGEVYVAQGRDVHVFNAFGMEVHRFQTELDLGPIRDLAVLSDGSLVVLAYDTSVPAESPQPLLSIRDFRGRRVRVQALSGAWDGLPGFRPNRLFLQRDRLLLLSTQQMLAAAATLDGTVVETLDLAALLGVPEDERDDFQISGAGMDPNGNLALSVAVLFRVFLVTPDGKVLASWGKSGSAPGAFGNAGGIDVDARGRVFVVDRIRKVVLIFDADERHTFLREFGGDPRELGRLAMPSDVVTDGNGRVYVTQVGSGGVSVFQVP